MQLLRTVTILCFVVLLAACGAAPSNDAPSTGPVITKVAGATGRGAFMSVTTAADASVKEINRGNGEHEIAVMNTLKDGELAAGSVAVSSSATAFLPNVKSLGVPESSAMELDPTTKGRALPTLGMGDSFLEQLEAGENYALGRYRKHDGNTVHHGYFIVDKGVSTPRTTGTATYTGKAHGYGVGSVSGAEEFTGKLEATATFGTPAGVTMTGRIKDITTASGALGFELAFDPGTTPQPDGAFSGQLKVEQVGGAVWPSANVRESYYVGDFHGANEAEMAGRFEVDVRYAPAPPASTEVVQDYQAVGVFGSAKQ
jgi:hypothetical protein